MNRSSFLRAAWAGLGWLVVAASLHLHAAGHSVFNVKDYGATGQKADNARPAIQRAIDACAAAGGGTVLIPPGAYTAGTLRLRSHLRIEIEAGATLFADPDPKAYEFGGTASKASLFYGEDVEDISLVGRGTVDGQAEYEWRDDDYERAFEHKTLMQKLGKSLRRPFPKGFPQREVFPHLVWLGRSKDVQISGLKFLHSPSWTLALYACERAVFDQLYIYSSLKEAVWADGIDLDGCRDVSVSNCTIETGDDCLVFISTDVWGPARVCENITVSNCRLASASAGVKFSEGNRVAIRRVLVSNTVLSPVNRGFVFSTTLGGHISDVVLSDLIMDCRRFDWFWAGDGQPFHFRVTRLSEFNQEPARPDEPPPGSIRNVVVRNVLAQARGSSPILGHAESRLEGVRFENLKLSMATDPAAPFDVAEHALRFRWASNLVVKDIEVAWEPPALDTWKSALAFDKVQGLRVEGFAGRSAWPEREVPALLFNEVADAVVRQARAGEGTTVFLKVSGPGSREICLQGNDLRHAKIPFRLGEQAPPDAVRLLENILPR